MKCRYCATGHRVYELDTKGKPYKRGEGKFYGRCHIFSDVYWLCRAEHPEAYAKVKDPGVRKMGLEHPEPTETVETAQAK